MADQLLPFPEAGAIKNMAQVTSPLRHCEYTGGNCTRRGCDRGCQAMVLARDMCERYGLEPDAPEEAQRHG